MEEERLQRYKDKINHIEKRRKEILEWTIGYLAEEFIHDDKTKLAVYKAFQEIAEAFMDITAMSCKDLKIVPKDDYTNIENLTILDGEAKKTLIEANGLRNRLFHIYNNLEDSLAFEGIMSILSRMENIIKGIEEWLRKEMQ